MLTGRRKIYLRSCAGFTPLEKVIPTSTQTSLPNGVKGRRSVTGFTMIEIILVSVIITTLLAVSMPAFSKIYADTRLKTCVQSLIATIRYVYQSAASQQIKYKINYDQAAGKYWVEKEQDSGEFQQVRAALLKPMFLPDNVVFKKISAAQVIFYPNGSADNFDIQLQNKNNKVYTIHFTGLTGQVEIFDYVKE